jgi:hypothetical protein
MSLLTINDGLEHYWKLDEAGLTEDRINEIHQEFQTTDTTFDTTDLIYGQVGGGASTPMSVVAGRRGLGNAIKFNNRDSPGAALDHFGTSKHFSYPTSGENGWTATALVKPGPLSGDFAAAPGVAVMGVNTGAVAFAGWGVGLMDIDATHFRFAFWAKDGVGPVNVLTSNPITWEDKFYHVLVGIDYTLGDAVNGTMVLRVDNAIYTGARTFPLVTTAGVMNFFVGSWGDGMASYRANFTIDEIGMWSRVITSEEWYWDIYRFGSGSTMPFAHRLYYDYGGTLYPAVSGQCRSNVCRAGYAPPFTSPPYAHDDQDDVVPLRRETYRPVVAPTPNYTEVSPWEDSQS